MDDDRRTVWERIDPNLIVGLTKQLIAIPSQNPPGKERPVAELILKVLSEWGIEVERVDEPEPARPQIVAWVRGSEPGPTLILNGHMDTVGEGKPGAWRHSPFAAVAENGRLYGLGSADMKGALAVAMVVLKTLKEAGRPRAGTVMFQAVMGEEMDEPGTKTLLQKGFTGDWAIVLEPTDLRIGPGTRGACWHRIVLNGPSVHCGLVAPETTDVMQAFATFATAVAQLHQRVSSQRHHLLPSPACRITQVEAGGPHNATAGQCRLLVDRRMLPHEAFSAVTDELTGILEEVTRHHPGLQYEIAFIAGNEPTETSLDDPLIQSLNASHRVVVGHDAEVWGPPYGCDMRNFVCDAGIPTTNFGPGDFTVCHQPDEFVEIADLGICARILVATALDLLEA